LKLKGTSAVGTIDLHDKVTQAEKSEDLRQADAAGGGAAGPGPLPCLNSNNADKVDSSTSYDRRVAYALLLNVERYIEVVGLQNVGFLTLTFGDHVTDPKEAYKRFNSLRRRLLSDLFGPSWVSVPELQKSGRLHFHLLVDCQSDIRSDFDHERVSKGDYRSANSHLRGIWRELRTRLPKYGFGRSELLPIRTNVEGMAKYVSKYIGKGAELRQAQKGIRRVRYSRDGWKCCSMRFAWASAGAKLWRLKLAFLSAEMGFTTFRDWSRAFGPRWAFHLKEAIMDRPMPLEGYKGDLELILADLKRHNERLSAEGRPAAATGIPVDVTHGAALVFQGATP